MRYERHTFREPWRSGDLVLVDDVRTAHAGEPYRGEREVLVGPAEARRSPIAGTGPR